MTARALAALAALAALTGCPRLDPMQRQQKYKAYQASEFHADGLAMRAPPAGTVAWQAAGDPRVQTGLGPDDRPLARSPLPPTPALLALGRKRFEITCAACHGLLGDGESQVALNMSLRRPPNLHLYRDVPDGYVFQVVTHGFGLMPSYGAELSPEERWGVVAYLRALQLSQHARVDQLPPDARAKLRGEGR
ncbi:MAG TPA: cytochrome c [Anaeromyxobacteraceae bacterium]|nr:cytochrome c [Anaeromyxobacteraceae bacterium]